MVQFYFLAVVCNLLGALFLISGKNLSSYDETDDEKKGTLTGIPLIDDLPVRLTVGLITLFTGIIKLLSPFSGIPVFGDLIPALACLMCGTSLLLEYYAAKTSPDNVSESVMNFFVGSRKITGFACLATAALHFIMPQVILL
ncbi:MAG: hypothetical protein J5780_02980 [Treponema sp.]|nr:hypothetical protein [Treponema sp.]